MSMLSLSSSDKDAVADATVAVADATVAAADATVAMITTTVPITTAKRFTAMMGKMTLAAAVNTATAHAKIVHARTAAVNTATAHARTATAVSKPNPGLATFCSQFSIIVVLCIIYTYT